MVCSRHSDAARTDYDIWRMCADGTQLASLVTEPGHQLQLSVAPDGSEFAYTSYQDGGRDIWRKPFGRGTAVNLTDHPAEDSQPAWSPDAGRIAFFSDRDAERLELYLLDLATGSIERVTENEYYDSGASWSPDGGKVVFTRYFPSLEGSESFGTGEIIEVELATGAERQLTELGGYNGGLSYSPDGQTIAFHRTHEESLGDLADRRRRFEPTSHHRHLHRRVLSRVVARR